MKRRLISLVFVVCGCATLGGEGLTQYQGCKESQGSATFPMHFECGDSQWYCRKGDDVHLACAKEPDGNTWGRKCTRIEEKAELSLICD